MPIKLVKDPSPISGFAWTALFALLLLCGGPALSEPKEAALADPDVNQISPPVATDPLDETGTGEVVSEADLKAEGIDNAPVAPPPRESPDPTAPMPAPLDESWGGRVHMLSEQIDAGLSQPEQADTLYHQLETELWAYQDEVDQSLRRRSPDALDQRAQLAAMYAARVELLQVVSPSLRSKLTGGGRTGMRELGREFSNAMLDLRFQTLAIPRGLRHIADGIRESPLDDLWVLLKFFFGVLVFRTWRRWAKTGLPGLRTQVLSVQPRSDTQLHTARLIWYVERFRGPLEWLALAVFASAIFEPGDLDEVVTLVRAIIVWTLLTRFGLLLVNALAARNNQGRSDRHSARRLRSLRLVAAWILLTGLGLDLTLRYVGEAAIYTWASRAFTLLLVPIVILLLHWWRADILRRLHQDSSSSLTARRIGRREKGLGSYVNAGAGALYILGADLLKFAIRVASNFEGGRRIVATLLRREVERGGQTEDFREKPISDELTLKLLTPGDTPIDAPLRESLDRITEVAKTGRGGSISVTAERGGGLSTFLRLLQDQFGTSMRIVDCPPGDPGVFGIALAEAFGLDRNADLHTALRPKIDAAGVRIIAVDNYHRIARPQMGGLEGMKAAGKIAEAVGEDILWIVTLTRASWPYINRMLGDQAILQEHIELPEWSEPQLGELFDARCKAAKIDPDYGQLVFPRQFEDGERDSLEERNRVSYRRILWELSDGNPEVAIRLFADSLRERRSGDVVVGLPQPASQSHIATANRTTLLILKVLVETEMATLDNLEASIREPRATLMNALGFCVQRSWIEKIEDHYQITWSAYRPVKRVLVRRGLIAR